MFSVECVTIRTLKSPFPSISWQLHPQGTSFAVKVNPMIKTKLTEMLDCKHPILQAAMGPFYTTKLCAAVSNAGAFGIVSHTNLRNIDPIAEMEKNILDVIENTDGTFGVNIRTARLQIDYPELIRLIPRLRKENKKVREQLRLVITSAGDPRPGAHHFKKLDPDLKVFHVIPAKWLAVKALNPAWYQKNPSRLEESKGFNGGMIDGIVATGYEGGGHNSYEKVATTVLTAEMVELAGDILVVSCGGWYSGKGLAGALAMGAAGVQMGTRFIATKECEFHDAYKALIPPATDEDTLMTTGAFGPIRLMKNEYSKTHGTPVPDREARMAEESGMTQDDLMNEMENYEMVYRGDVQKGPILVGQTIGGIDTIPSVKEVVDSIMKEAEEHLKSVANLIK
jgi:enoyl-[acyl-carrier protein] reductase II